MEGDNYWKRWLIPHNVARPKRGTFGPLAIRCAQMGLAVGVGEVTAHQGDDP